MSGVSSRKRLSIPFCSVQVGSRVTDGPRKAGQVKKKKVSANFLPQLLNNFSLLQSFPLLPKLSWPFFISFLFLPRFQNAPRAPSPAFIVSSACSVNPAFLLGFQCWVITAQAGGGYICHTGTLFLWYSNELLRPHLSSVRCCVHARVRICLCALRLISYLVCPTGMSVRWEIKNGAD